MQRTLQRLAVGTERATALANRLLTLARAGTYVRSKQSDVDLVALAKNAIVDHLPAANARAQDLGFEGPVSGAPVVVHGDRILLRELVSNLIDNAVRYSPDRGVITVFVRRERGGGGTIGVRDTRAGRERGRARQGVRALLPRTRRGCAGHRPRARHRPHDCRCPWRRPSPRAQSGRTRLVHRSKLPRARRGVRVRIV
jgi:hypothetical protein